MENNMVFRTRSGSYLYSIAEKHLFTISPVMEKILSLGDEKIEKMEEAEIVSKLQKMNDGKASVELYEHYLYKYRMLKKSGYFKELDARQYLAARVSPEIIERNLANTRQVVFEVTQECNLACRYCTFGENYDNHEMRNHKSMKIETVATFIDYMLTLKNMHNSSHCSYFDVGFYGGEPLLNFALIEESVGYLKNLGVTDRNIGFSMTTNGLLIKEHIDFLVRQDFHLFVSIDGDRECNGLRLQKNGQPSFEIVFENLKFIKNQYPEYFKRNVNFAVVSNCKNTLERIYDFFKEEFDKTFHISEINKLGFNVDHLEKYHEMYKSVSQQIIDLKDRRKDILDDMYEKLPEGSQLLYFCNHSLFNFFRDYYSLLYPYWGNRLPSSTCIPFSKKVYITSLGSILQCERIGHSPVLGKVTTKGVNIDFQQIADKFNAFADEIIELCTTCYNHRSCMQCGFYIEKENGGFKCPKFKTKEAYRLELKKRITELEHNPGSYKKIIKELDLVW